jgi:hypothetical protein
MKASAIGPICPLVLAVTVVALAAGGCSTNPTGPSDATAPADTLRVYLYSVTSPATCEDILTGLDGGEFIWRIAVDWPDGTVDELDKTPRYPSLDGYVSVRQNQPYTIDKEVTHVMHSKAGDQVTIQVQATEVDFDIFGNNPAPDSRMNAILALSHYSYNAIAGWPLGSHVTWLRPDPACQLRVDYAFLP